MFVAYVHFIRALARLLGQVDDPVHQAWARDVAGILRRWERKRAPLDDRILPLLMRTRPITRLQTGAEKRT